ncbi:proton-coupled amino acid transporter 2-like [Stigmatopora nigra]
MITESTTLLPPQRHSVEDSEDHAPIHASLDRFGDALLEVSQQDPSGRDSAAEAKSSTWATFVHLLKGYMGAGCLSLPWAVTQLGMVWGPVAIVSVSVWSSYNCWSIVRIKRYIEARTNYKVEEAETASEISSARSVATSLTYPEVGDWAYGVHFQTFVALCVCTQQLAICTVFFSFVGENLLAVGQWLEIDSIWITHVGVLTMTFPFIMILSLIPNLKLLTPAMATGTMLLLVSFAAIAVVIVQEWPHRPSFEDLPSFKPAQAPLAVSAILYSYEGINLILPVESNMQDGRGFQAAFMAAMVSVALILVCFSGICVVTFGNITSGSVTAYLLDTLDDDSQMWWLMIANSAVSLSVLLTYPLQLFPALELLGPIFSRCSSMGEVASALFLGPKLTMPGDSIQLRVSLVFMTYLVAVVVPNVQALISLAGAVAGSSSALLIPPIS